MNDRPIIDDENLHQNHRKRMRDKFFNEGFKNFGPHEVIEFLLFFTIPRVNTNETAHRLLHRFGSVSALFDASKEALMEAGCSESTAALFKAIPLCFRVYFGSKNETLVYDSPKKLMSLFTHEFPVKNVEEFRLACFSPKLHLIGNTVHVINEGAPNTVEINLRNLVKTVILSETNSVAVSHNHPNASSYPSHSDISSTRYIGQTLRAFGVSLLDHIIIGTDGPYSMRERGHFNIFE